MLYTVSTSRLWQASLTDSKLSWADEIQQRGHRVIWLYTWCKNWMPANDTIPLYVLSYLPSLIPDDPVACLELY